MNVLKEMGIQQWRRRTALPVSVAIDDQQDNLSPTSSAPVQRDGNSQVGFTETAPEPIHGGGSGSLRQALIKSQTDEVKAPLEDKVSGSSVEPLNQEAVLDESAVLAEPKLASESQPSVKEHSSQLQTPSTEQKPLSSESSAEPNESTAKAVTVALDISDLLGSVEQETQEGDFYQGEELSDATDNVALESFGIETVGDKSHEQPQADQLSTLDWAGLQSIIETNEHCPSCGWGNGLIGSGDQSADWMFVIDAPNSTEIEGKTFFTGRAGQLFDAMLLALGLSREQVYCSSVFKCAPTDDLSITSQCDAMVLRQIELVAPKVVISFGEFAAQALLKSNSVLEALRANEQQCFRTQTTVVPTYSPQEMLDNSALKAKVWSDLKKAMHLMAS